MNRCFLTFRIGGGWYVHNAHKRVAINVPLRKLCLAQNGIAIDAEIYPVGFKRSHSAS